MMILRKQARQPGREPDCRAVYDRCYENRFAVLTAVIREAFAALKRGCFLFYALLGGEVCITMEPVFQKTYRGVSLKVTSSA
jgi:hypothetical protein